ncbi:MAG: hypothetical protein AB7U82_22530 [Blastocatellales bacterium]
MNMQKAKPLSLLLACITGFVVMSCSSKQEDNRSAKARSVWEASVHSIYFEKEMGSSEPFKIFVRDTDDYGVNCFLLYAVSNRDKSHFLTAEWSRDGSLVAVKTGFRFSDGDSASYPFYTHAYDFLTNKLITPPWGNNLTSGLPPREECQKHSDSIGELMIERGGVGREVMNETKIFFGRELSPEEWASTEKSDAPITERLRR